MTETITRVELKNLEKYRKKLEKLNNDLAKLNTNREEINNSLLAIANIGVLKKKKQKGSDKMNKLQEKIGKIDTEINKLNIIIGETQHQINEIENKQLRIKTDEENIQNEISKAHNNTMNLLLSSKAPIEYFIKPKFQILENTDHIINKIIHIADIHIQLNKFHDEYKLVFDSLYNELNDFKLKEPNTIICICGDILDVKYVLNTDVIIMTRQFIKCLSLIFPTFIIAGNHDMIENNIDKPDSISAILGDDPIPNIYNFKDSGIYIYNNIIFGISSLIDHHVLHIDELNKILDENKFVPSVNTKKVGLYHGYLSGATLNNESIVFTEKKYLTDFGDYDLLLLGDIHKFQYLKNNVAYPSSLISHNFAEFDDFHGFIEWDVHTSESKYHKIQNDNAYHIINIDKLIDYEKSKKKEIILSEILINNELDKYKNGFLRIDYSEKLDINRNHITEHINSLYPKLSINYNIIYDQTQTQDKETTHDERIEQLLDDTNDALINDKPIEELIKEYVKQNFNTLNDETINRILLYLNITNDKTAKNIEYIKSDWKILMLSFSYMYGYGKKNVIDFTKYPFNEVIGLFGNNAIGKSSLIDIITYMLFSRSPREEDGILPKDILNVKVNDGYGIMIIESNNTKYVIERTCRRVERRKRDNKSELIHTMKIIQLLEPNETDEQSNNIPYYTFQGKKYLQKNITGVDRVDSDRILTPIIGTYENFLSTAVLLQGKDTTFKTKSNNEKKEFLCKILKIDHLSSAYDEIDKKVSILKKEVKIYQDNINKLSNKSVSQLNDEITSNVTKLPLKQRELEELNIQLQNKENELLNVIKKVININQSKYKIKNDKDQQLNDKLLKDIKQKLLNCSKLENTLKSKISDNELIISNLSTLKNQPSIKENYDNYLDSIKQQRNVILEQINNINIKRRSLQLTKVYGTLLSIKQQLDTKNRELIILTSNIDKINKQINKLSIQIKNLKLLDQKDAIIDANNIYHIETENKLKSLMDEINVLIIQKQNIQLIKIPDDLTLDILNNNSQNYHSCLDEINNFLTDIRTKKILDSSNKINSNYKKLMTSSVDLIYTKLNELKTLREDEENFNNEIDEIIDTLNIVLNRSKDSKPLIVTKYEELLDFNILYESKNKEKTILISQIDDCTHLINDITQNNISLDKINNIDQIIKARTDIIDSIKSQKQNLDQYEQLQNELQINSSYLDQINKLQLELKQKTIDQNALTQQIDKLRCDIDIIKKNDIIIVEIKKLDNEIGILQSSLTKIDNDDDNEVCKLYKLLETEQLTKNDISDKLNQLRQQLVDNHLMIVKYTKNIDEINNALREYVEMKNIIKDNNNLQTQIDDLNNEIKLIKENIKTIENDIRIYETQIDKNKDLITKLNVENETLNISKNEKDFYDTLKKICGHDGLQLYLLNQYLDKITYRVNQLLEPFIGKKINMTLEGKKIDIQIISNDKVLHITSGMESLMLDIVFKIIIGQITLIPKSNFIFIDESISVLDKDRIESIGLFFDFLKKYYKNIFIITHMQNIKEHIRFFLDIYHCDGFSLINNLIPIKCNNLTANNIQIMIDGLRSQLIDNGKDITIDNDYAEFIDETILDVDKVSKPKTTKKKHH